jgi:hypothetical protein
VRPFAGTFTSWTLVRPEQRGCVSSLWAEPARELGRTLVATDDAVRIPHADGREPDRLQNREGAGFSRSSVACAPAARQMPLAEAGPS